MNIDNYKIMIILNEKKLFQKLLKVSKVIERKKDNDIQILHNVANNNNNDNSSG